MTQTFSPEDTGEIQRIDVGETTQNIGPYSAFRPLDRRPDATGEFPAYNPVTIGIVAPAPSDTGHLPIAPPEYVGRHRAPDDMPADIPPGRFGALRSVLSAAWARVRGAM